MARRRYGQFCGLVRALEIVGERWALLIVRDLLVEPKRFTDLKNGLPGIPTNVLSARLKELEAAGIVERWAMPSPDRSVVYRLTEYGRGLDEAVLALGRWGAESLTEPQEGDVVTPESMVMAMRSTFQPERAQGRNVIYELRLGEVVVSVRVVDGSLEATAGGAADTDLVIESGPAIKALMAGDITPDEAIDTGAVRITGDPELLDWFSEMFRI